MESLRKGRPDLADLVIEQRMPLDCPPTATPPSWAGDPCAPCRRGDQPLPWCAHPWDGHRLEHGLPQTDHGETPPATLGFWWPRHDRPSPVETACTMSHTIREKTKRLNRVRRIRGQVEAVERALDEGLGCTEVLQLIAGARGVITGLG
jgi:Metal-sensitive transcriptional repressor